MISILIAVVLTFTWKSYKSEIVVTDDGNPNQTETDRMTILFEDGFEDNFVFFMIGSDTLVNHKIWTDFSTGMATDFMTTNVQNGNNFTLKVDRQQFDGSLDLRFKTLIIRSKTDHIEFYYTNEKWLLYD